MEQYTILNQNEITQIAAQFNIHDIATFKLLSGGSENTNYLVRSKNGNYVLCLCEQKTPEQANALADLLKYLEVNNFRTSKIIPTVNDQSIIIWQDKPIMLRTFLEGTIQKDLNTHLLTSIGKALAKLHQIEPPHYLPKQLAYGKEQFAQIKKYDAGSEFDLWLEMILEYMHPYFMLDLPKSLIHSDLFWDNVIINEAADSVTIMDFEEAAHYYRVFDIGMTIIGICGAGKKVNHEKVKHLLKGYQSENELTNNEVKALKAFTIYAAASMSYWRHQNFNYVKPNPKMHHHYLRLKVLADYMLNLDDAIMLDLIKN